ncbi:hypothetical protein E1295_15515 [Nonomuraea mesophila]|uniref:Uncharacterized protein n=1 Tax=Nonomuraea mesophila TaxID=2530382 RepID=A0A4R5FMC9_9ACTN|nr:hypothetical protein [Nonomuraea mesophila]TDE54052.1 hypothetical protein E1295_15515 [Nonomuraea mesophila]
MTVAGVCVLLVNDHLLKQAWPGFVTGKLSDVAGLVVAPALLALLFLRRADLAATVLTGVLFALVKSTETGAEAASQAWTLVAGPSRVLADPTDLLALPALALAWWVRGRSLRAPSPKWRVVAAMPLTVLAVAATSAVQLPAAESVEVDGDRIVVHVADGLDQVSHNGGATWSAAAGHEPATGLKSLQSAACVPMQATRCYRVVPERIAVEQSDDGGRTWQPSWELSGDDRERLRRTHSGGHEHLSMALAAQARPGGHVVVVANGLDGIVVRDVQGTWRRVGWPGQAAERAATVNVSLERNVALFLAACLLFGGVGAGLREFHRVYTGFAVLACLGPFAMVAEAALAGQDGFGLVVLGWVMATLGTLVCGVLAFAGRARPVTAVVGVVGAPLVYAAVYLPFRGWARGAPDTYEVAVAIAAVLTAVVLVAGAALIRQDAGRPGA